MPRRAAERPAPGPTLIAGGVAAVDRALTLLGAFRVDAPMLTLSELAERTGQYKSTVLRLLASLENAHLVRRLEDGRFALGSAIARLHAIHAVSFSIGDVVVPALRALVEATRESAAFHVRQGEQDLCLYRVDSPNPVRDHTRAGDVRPLARSVAGRVLLAYPGGGGARGARIRQQQLLVADGDIVPELSAFAAPVFVPSGDTAGVLVLTMPSVRLVPTHAHAVRAAARRLTEQLGGPYPAPGGIRANPR